MCRRRRHCFAPPVLVNSTFFFFLYFRISRFWCFIFVLRNSLLVELWRSCPVQPGAVGRAGGANFREDSASCWQIHPTFSSLGGEAASMTKRRSEKSLCRSFPGQNWTPTFSTAEGRRFSSTREYRFSKRTSSFSAESEKE